MIPIGPRLRPGWTHGRPRSDPKVIPIRAGLTAGLSAPPTDRPDVATEAPRLFPRLERRRTPPLQLWLAGLCWVLVVLL